MTTITKTHEVYCRECGDELGTCEYPSCDKVRKHKSNGLCVWCVQHPASMR